MSNTIKIKSSHPETQGEFVIIDEKDFDEKVHEKFDGEAEEKPAKQRGARGKKAVQDEDGDI